MTKVSKIIEKIENFAPSSLAADWDNSGWQIYLGNAEVKKTLLAISPDINVINQAIEKNCGLIISHHPLLFEKINRINSGNIYDMAIIKAIQHNIPIYSAHTNLDVTKNGIADKLAGLFELKNLETFEDFVRIGELEKEENFANFLVKLKNVLNINKLSLINPANMERIKRIAVCPGSGGDLIEKLSGIDLYITSDIKYHSALKASDMIVVDAGHLETERIILPVLRDLLLEFDLEILIAEEESPFDVV